MTTQRRKKILNALATGGAINAASGKCAIVHPDSNAESKISNEETRELLNAGYLVVVGCGVNGFWWTIRQDLIAAYV